METQMTTKEKNELAKTAAGTAWGTENVRNETILIPKILLMQGLSKQVAEEKAQMGDFLNSLSNKVIGTGREKAKEDLKVVPIKMFESWVIFEKIEQKKGEAKLEWKGIEPLTAANADWALEDEDENGVPIRRDRALNFYVLLQSELDDPRALPYLLSFRRTSYNAGRKLSTHFAQCRKAGVPPARDVFVLSATKESNDHGTFYVWDANPADEKITDEQLTEAYNWYQTLQTKDVEIDNSDLEAEGGTTRTDKDERASDEVRESDEF